METDKLLKALPHPFIVDMCVMLSNKKIVSRIKSDEEDFVKQIECNGIKREVLGCLPPLLSSTKWSVSPKLLKILREWVTDNDYYIKLLNYISNHRNIEKENLVYLLGALKETEKCFSDRIKSLTTPSVVLKQLNKLPNLWWCIKTIDRYMQPSQYLVEAMIGVFANIPSNASRQLAFLAADLKKADVRKSTFVKVRYISLGDFNENPFLYVKVPTENVRKAMPHHYILSLCSRALWQSKTEGVFFDKSEITKEYENEYIRLIQDRKIDKSQLSQLSKLWKKANWHPLNEIEKLLKDYKESPKL